MFLLLVAVVELPQELDPLALAPRNLVEVFLHFGGEVRLDEVAEMIAQQCGYGERGEAGYQGLALPEDVSAANDGGNRRRKGGRPADTESLQFLDERGLRIPRGRRGLVLLRLGIEEDDRGSVAADLVANAALRQDGFLLFELRNRVVAAFYVRPSKTCELNRLAAGREHRNVTARRVCGNLDRRPKHAGVNHLRRHRPFPDQLVNFQVVAVEHPFELTWRKAEVCRANRFVRFLGVLDPRLISTRPIVILAAKHFANDARRFLKRLVRQRRGIRTVIGDQTFHLAVADIDALEQP